MVFYGLCLLLFLLFRVESAEEAQSSKNCEHEKDSSLKFMCLVNEIQAQVVNKDQIMEDIESIPYSSASGSRRIGESCTINTDCVVGAYCSAGLCQCWSTHVSVERYCWRKVNPEESGCSYDAQCDAVWPGATCVFSICRCPSGKVAAATREGPVCHVAGQCPTNGQHSMLYNRNTNTPSSCFFFDGEEKRAGRFIGCDDFPEVHECIDGLCCPSRALTCIQPMDGGEGGNDTTVYASRWYFDSISGSCQQFNYTSIGGNANNFMTKQQCESYCDARCSRGQPQLDVSSGDSDPLTSLSLTCSGNNQCDEDRFNCVRRSAISYCCPKPEFICSEYGGLSGEMVNLHSPPSIQSYSSGSNRQGQMATTRWYWDRQDKKCRTFKYLGQGGNFNNFLSEQQCVEFCTRALCPFGSPLRLSSGMHIECSSNTQCPRSHHCVAGVCCPSPATVCNQPLSEGVACHSETVQRYWFNPAQSACQMFSYKGCQGNANNFVTLHECHTFCSTIEEEPKCPVGEPLRLEDGKYWKCGKRAISCPSHFECYFDGKTHGCCPTKTFTCRQPPDGGRLCSTGISLRWYFDHSQGKCQTFSFKGCDGNSNNFGSQRDCEDYCGESGCPNGGDYLRRSTGGAVDCTADASTCPTSHQCTTLVSSSDTPSSKFCCPSRLSICSEGFESGYNCTEPVRRYFFDPSLRACRPFTYRGCGGNGNNFLSRMACFNFCQSSACATSEIVYHSQTSDLPYDCTHRSCPKSYMCVIDSLDKERKVCCGSPNLGVCPGDQRPYLDHRTQKPQSCSPNQRNTCPMGFFCILNNEKNSYYCCGDNVKPVTCPEGAKIVRNPSTQDPLGCSADSQCPAGKCYQPDSLQTGICCSNLDNVCPPMFSLDKERTESAECSPLIGDSCSAQHQSVCLFSERMHRFVCCKRDERRVSSILKCPGNTEPDESKSFCSTDQPCPSPYFCARQNADRIGMCCKHPKIVQVTVPTISPITTTTVTTTTTKPAVTCNKDERSLIDEHTGQPTQCNMKFPCPAPYTCKPSFQDSNTRICCEEIELKVIKCPSGTVSLSTNGRVQSCKGATCPMGYECIQEMCCPTKEFSCNEPLFMGTPCEDGPKRTVIRYYYAQEVSACRMFEFRGCNPNANHFVDKQSCERECVNGGDTDNTKLECPSPYINPFDTPQICSPFFASCKEGHKCLSTTNRQYICCSSKPSSNTSSSLRTLMSKMCGKGWNPILSTTGDPRRCDNTLLCDKGSMCKYSDILMLDICCAPEDEEEEEVDDSSPNQTAKFNPIQQLSLLEPPNVDHLNEMNNAIMGIENIDRLNGMTSSNGGGSSRLRSMMSNGNGMQGSPSTRRFSQPKKGRCKPTYKMGEEIPPHCKHVKFPGDSGCDDQHGCTGQSHCVHGVCVCNREAVLFQKMCYWRCPSYYRNISGICI